MGERIRRSGAGRSAVRALALSALLGLAAGPASGEEAPAAPAASGTGASEPTEKGAGAPTEAPSATPTRTPTTTPTSTSTPPRDLASVSQQSGLDLLRLLLSTHGLALLAASVLGAFAACWKDKRVALLAGLLAAHAVGVSFRFELGEFVKGSSWLLALLALALFFREELRTMLAALSKRFESGKVDVQITSHVAIKLEPPTAESAAPALPFSRSPFDLERESVVDESGIRFELAPQIFLWVSDYAAKYWARDASNDERVQKLETAWEDLESACARHDADVLKAALKGYSEALQRCRFLGADKLVRLRKQCGELDAALGGLEKRKGESALSAADRGILHCLGVGYAPEELWSVARDLLKPMVETGRYLPAADTYLVCLYNAYIKESKTDPTTKKEKDIDKETFLRWFSDVWRKSADRLLKESEAADWSKDFGGVEKAFHVRELYKTLGTIERLVAENLSQAELYDVAEEHLKKCTGPIDGETGSPLDHNNLADLLVRRSKYGRAHEELDKAFELSRKAPTPIFHSTRAEVFREEGRLWEGVEVLLGYTAEQARKGDVSDLRFYVANQILAAKLVAEDRSLGRSAIAVSVDILKRAAGFLEEVKGSLGEAKARELECEIQELLGVAYLEIPDGEEKAIAALQRALDACRKERLEARWKKTIALARAHTRRAKSLRRRRSAREATGQRLEAETRLTATISRMNELPVGDAPTAGRRGERFRLHFDALVANQEVAEESFHQGDLSAAKRRLENVIALLWDHLDQFHQGEASADALGDGVARMRHQLDQYRAYRHFLSGRILGRSEPVDLEAVRALMRQAKEVDAGLSAWVDVELGAVLLAAAGRKTDDPTLYDEAVRSLEAAAASDEPTPRAEALRLLAVAYPGRAAASARPRPSSPAAS